MQLSTQDQDSLMQIVLSNLGSTCPKFQASNVYPFGHMPAFKDSRVFMSNLPVDTSYRLQHHNNDEANKHKKILDTQEL